MGEYIPGFSAALSVWRPLLAYLDVRRRALSINVTTKSAHQGTQDVGAHFDNRAKITQVRMHGPVFLLYRT